MIPYRDDSIWAHTNMGSHEYEMVLNMGAHEYEMMQIWADALI